MGKDLESKAKVASNKNRKAKKKRSASDVDNATHEDHEAMDGILVEDNANEPTMGEKLASLNLLEDQKTENHDKQESPSRANPPSADSVNILLKQALHSDDRALLLDCLYTQDEKVIDNSISQLRPSDVIKLLHFLISIIQSRGAIVACALPWLKSLVLQHASGIMSQETSLVALNSLYQIIESKVSTFQSAIQLSSCLDSRFAGVVDDSPEENETIVPVIFEDKDDSEEQESEGSMETDNESNEEEAFNEGVNGSDFEGSGGMSE